MIRRPGSIALRLLLAALLAGCSEDPTAPASPSGPGAPSPVASVVVNPARLTLDAGSTATLSAVTSDSRGIVLHGRPITWSSSDTTVAVVSASGLVSARRAGAASIRASSEGKSGSMEVAVAAEVPTDPPAQTVAWILITPAGGLIPQAIGTTRQLGVIARASDGTEIAGRPVAWSSGNPAVASVSATGLLAAHAAGTSWIAAVVDGRRDSTLVSVPSLIARIVTDADTLRLVVGDARTITATAIDANGAPLVRAFAWSSSNGAVATVDASGRVVATGAGTALVTVTSEGKRATTLVTVTGAQLHLGDVAGAPLPAIVDSVTVTVNGEARTARFQATDGTLRFHDGRYELRLSGWLLADGVAPVAATVTSDGVLVYDVFTGAPLFFEREDWENHEPRFRGRFRADGGVEVDWNRTPGAPVVALGFAR